MKLCLDLGVQAEGGYSLKYQEVKIKEQVQIKWMEVDT
ncbi:protein of unknown function [Bacillus velezensis]|nr:protein of unknown function [Bacillus velezensis]